MLNIVQHLAKTMFNKVQTLRKMLLNILKVLLLRNEDSYIDREEQETN
jgi:hypothetical protein